MAWLEKFAAEFGDKMPDSNKIHLPSSLTRKDVHQRMEMELKEVGEKPCSLTRFLYLWRTEHRDISIPKVNRFSKCDECVMFKSRIYEASTKEERRKIQAERDAHLHHQNAERRKYYKHILKAKTNPNKYMSMIIDGMDQHTTQLPKTTYNPKGLANMWKIPIHITGIIVHGKGQHAFCDMNEIPHDSNLTANVILQVLKKYVNELPPVLYLQVDNCSRENKNRFVFSLCCLLVELQLFRKIKVSFLPVGHTHEDIDQFFSRISEYLRKQNVQTLRELLDLIPKAYKKLITTAEQLMAVFDIRGWFKGHLNHMSQHSRPHVFKFTLDNQGKAIMKTKMWASTGEEWKECEYTDVTRPFILCSVPDGIPQIVLPSITKTKPDSFLPELPKLRKYPWFKEHHEQEWIDIINKLKAAANGEETDVRFPLHDICFDSQHVSVTISQQPDAVQSQTKRPLEPDVVVQVGPKKKRKEEQINVIEPGKMVCMYSDEYPNDWPQVAEVVECPNDSEFMTVKWYHASYTGYCYVFKKMEKGNRIEWVEDVRKDDVISNSFDLLPSTKLPKNIVDLLKVKEKGIFT